MAQYNIQYHAALVAVSDTAILFFLIQVRAQIEIELVTPPQPALRTNITCLPSPARTVPVP
jgi:hypothetical protein